MMNSIYIFIIIRKITKYINLDAVYAKCLLYRLWALLYTRMYLYILLCYMFISCGPILIWPIYVQLVSLRYTAVQYNFPSDLGIIHLSSNQSFNSQPPTLYIYTIYKYIIHNHIITTLLYYVHAIYIYIYYYISSIYNTVHIVIITVD